MRIDPRAENGNHFYFTWVNVQVDLPIDPGVREAAPGDLNEAEEVIDLSSRDGIWLRYDVNPQNGETTPQDCTARKEPPPRIVGYDARGREVPLCEAKGIHADFFG
jgi:hypothetical protein